MEVADVRSIKTATQLRLVVRKLYAMCQQHVGGSTHRGGTSITVLGDIVATGRNHKGRTSGDIKSVFAVTARTYDIEGIIVGEIYMTPRFQKSVAETEQFIHRDATGLHGHEECCDLAVVVTLLSDTQKDVMGVLAGQRLTLYQYLKILFHKLFLIIRGYYPILYHSLTIGCKYTFWMKLYAAHIVFLVTKSHDLTFVGDTSNLQTFGQRISINHP